MLLAGIAAFFYYLWITVIRSSRNNKLSSVSPPEVAGAFPILGHPLQIIGSRPLFKILADMSDIYESIFMVRIGMHPTLVVFLEINIFGKTDSKSCVKHREERVIQTLTFG